VVTVRHRRHFWGTALIALAVGAASCTSTGAIELSDDSLPDTPVTIASRDTTTSEGTEDPTVTTTAEPALTTVPDTAPPGTVYNTASVGAPVLVFDDGVVALGVDGSVTPIANGATTAGSDLAGGIVYQVAAGPDATQSTAIYWLPAGATEATETIPNGADPITLQGITAIGGVATAIYIRHSDPPVLERAPIAGGDATVLNILGEGDAQVGRVHVVGPYLTGAWSNADASNQGWVLYNAASGDRIGGTRIGGTDPCSNDGNCPSLVTISKDGANIYRLIPSGDSLRLLVTRSANGQQVANLELDRASGTWYPEQLIVQGDAVIISRTQEDDPASATLPALVVNITSGDVFQLTETGLVRPVE
jgi:hypothetical protein